MNKIPPQLIANGTPNTILGTDRISKITDYPQNIINNKNNCPIVWSSTTTITVNPGIKIHDTNGVFLISTAMSKSLNSIWLQGDGAGGMVDDPKGPNKLYNIFLIRNASYVVDVIISSETTPTVPSGWFLGPRLGTIFTNTSSQVTKFKQLGNTFYCDSFYRGDVVNGPNETSVSGDYTLNLAECLPPGGNIFAMIKLVALSSNGGIKINYIRRPSQPAPILTSIGMLHASQTSKDMDSRFYTGLPFIFDSSRQIVINSTYTANGPSGAGGHLDLRVFIESYIDSEI